MLGNRRTGRGSALNRLVSNAKLKRQKQYQQAYDQHQYDGSDPDVGEPLEA